MTAMPPSNDDDRTVIAMPRPTAPISQGGGNTLLPGTRLGEFEITGLLGEGGFGIVYLAQDLSLHRKIALKEYMPSALAARSGAMTVSVKSARHAETFTMGLKSFVNEARLLAQFDHPSLVKVYRFWEANGTAYMVMPFYEGDTLKDALGKLSGPPDEHWLKDLLRPLLDALEVMHNGNCFHRDIAPDNILILKDGKPLLLDFGAARQVIGDMTHALTVILKPGYAPVEQYAEMPNMKQGPWTDIYALASVVYFAIMGKAPAPSVARMMSDPLEPLSQVAVGRYSGAFLSGIDKALAVKPDDRPQSIAELRVLWGLSEAAPAGIPEPGKTQAEASRPDTKKPLAKYVTAGVAIITAIAGSVFFLTRIKSPDEATVSTQPSIASPAPQPEKAPASEPIKNADPPTTPIEKPFSPAIMLDEVFEGRNRDHAVTASVEKAQVRIGRDNLRFSISSSKPGYLYVLVVGTNRSDFDLLFPNTVDKNNRITPAQTRKLPGRNWPMKAQGPAGTNQFLAIVSDEPRDFSDLKPAPDDIFQKFPLDIGMQLYRDYSGATPLFAGRAACTPGSQCLESYGATTFSIEEIAGNSP